MNKNFCIFNRVYLFTNMETQRAPRRRRNSVLAGKIEPGWFIMKLTFMRREQDVYLGERRPNIIHCKADYTVDVFKVEGLTGKALRNKLKQPYENLPIRDFRRKYGEREGDIWGPYTSQAECVRMFMKGDYVTTTEETVVNGVSLAKEVQAIPIFDVTVQQNAKSIQRLATAVVETTELREDPPEKEVADIDKILLCNNYEVRTGRTNRKGRKAWLHVWYIMLASIIASGGLWLNSGPTVVASMLVSSMMEPIKGMATIFKQVKSSRSDWQRFLFHFLTLLLDMCICLGIGAVVGGFAQMETWGQSETEVWIHGNETFRYTLLELLSDNNVVGERRTVVGDKSTMFLPGEMSGRTKSLGLWGALIIAAASAMALSTADKSQNKSALVGIGISASLLPPFVNAGMLWSFIGSNKIPVEHSFAFLGGISFALAWVNIAVIVVVWGVGFQCRKGLCKREEIEAGARAIEMIDNPMRERTPLLF
jgi:hypothetical protein